MPSTRAVCGSHVGDAQGRKQLVQRPLPRLIQGGQQIVRAFFAHQRQFEQGLSLQFEEVARIRDSP